MTDIRKTAKAVIDSLSNCVIRNDSIHNAVNALRQALDAPVEPVAWVDLDVLNEDEYAHALKRKVHPRQSPLYTTPPSVDALIAEAVATEREECAKLCEDRWQYGNAVDCSQAIRARGQK